MVLMTGFSHVAHYFQSLPVLQQVSVLHSFLWLDDIPRDGYRHLLTTSSVDGLIWTGYIHNAVLCCT